MESIRERIKKNVLDQLNWDTRIESSNIRIDVDDANIVKLSGTVPNYNALRAAESDTYQVFGVNAVENNLKVKYPSENGMTDNELRSKVESMLTWDSRVNSERIQVSVKNGTADLTGTVETFWERKLAEDIALSANGINAVKNYLEVQVGNKYTDEQIARDVTSAIDRNRHVEIEDINIAVHKGVVTLSGEVPNPLAASAAYEAALYTAGVVYVNDGIRVESKATVPAE